jgi:uncharacterized protein involved in exopolysaccharide biosynthesis
MHTGPQRVAPMREPVEEIDIRDYLTMLWRHRIAIFVAGALLALVAFVRATLAPAVYEAEVPVMVSRPKVYENLTDLTAVANFIPLVANQNVAAQVIKELELDRAPYGFSPSFFFGSVVSVDEVKNSTILVVRGRLSNPALVARMVNRIAELGSDAVRDMNRKEAEQVRDDIKLQLDESRKRMELAEQRLKDARQKSEVELLKKDIDAQLLERSGLLKLQMDLEKERGQLAKAEEELAARKKVDVVNRTIDSEPALVETARAAGAPPRDLLGLNLRSEEVNSVYQALDEEVAKHRTAVAGLERQRAEVAARKLDQPQLTSLQRLYVAEAEISRLEMEQDLARKVYQEVATSYEKARLTVAARSSALQILEPAVAPDRPVPKLTVRLALIAFIAGATLAAFAFVLRHAVALPARP